MAKEKNELASTMIEDGQAVRALNNYLLDTYEALQGQDKVNSDLQYDSQAEWFDFVASVAQQAAKFFREEYEPEEAG